MPIAMAKGLLQQQHALTSKIAHTKAASFEHCSRQLTQATVHLPPVTTKAITPEEAKSPSKVFVRSFLPGQPAGSIVNINVFITLAAPNLPSASRLMLTIMLCTPQTAATPAGPPATPTRTLSRPLQETHLPNEDRFLLGHPSLDQLL
ncbi:hypothetical protein PCASD_26606 [Puccinia coronata f. sp. avenae]|uniref:Uncharacterized protein n=1 Tax=Puccinia coronata f. sp. avenae TaxID=200324 RepID=A0A2N5S1Q3_9BASI|nr:hypothetical protein PCASD_26606 [Puccinia coronata f. sp. avenae]